MASKTLLLDLPNELFPFIFQYLNSIDILKAFSDFKSHRIQALIQPFISRLDISQESNEWTQTYLIDVITKHEIIALRVQMKHLPFVAEHLLSINIESIQVIKSDYDYEFSEEVMGQLRRHLKELILISSPSDETGTLAGLLFQSDSQLKHLIIKHFVLYFSDDEISICTSLTHLSIKLEGMYGVFVLIEHLPNLQELKVEMLSQECIGQAAPETNGVKPCNTLRSVTFTGWIKCFDHLESFFATFGSTIEYLTLNIHLIYYTVDGKRLENSLLKKMPRLSSLDLIVFSALGDTDPIEIETFQSFTWQQFNPVVYWNDVSTQQHTIFTLPYKSGTFGYLSNDFLSTCVFNRPVSLCFERVRTLSLINTTPLNRDIFLFIRKVFPNITTIELKNWFINTLAENEDDEEDEELTSALSISEDLLSDTSLKIPSVTKFCIDVCSQEVDYKTFRRFLNLFPRLVELELDHPYPLLHDVLKHEHEDNLVETVLFRIEKLKIIDWHQSETLTAEEIHYLFPNVKNRVKPDNDEFE